MAKYYRTYVVEIDTEEMKRQYMEEGLPEPTEKDLLEMCDDYSIDDVAWWYGKGGKWKNIRVIDEHIEK